MTVLYAVKAFDGGAAPAYFEHGGRPVTWRPWRAPQLDDGLVLGCAGCGPASAVWSANGLIGGLAGLVFGLVAYRCDTCRHTSVFDMAGPEWVELDLRQAGDAA